MRLQTQFVLRGNGWRFAEANDGGGGMSVTPLNLRFYLSEVSLVLASGALLPVDIVTPQGRPVSYGVQLVNADLKRSL